MNSTAVQQVVLQRSLRTWLARVLSPYLRPLMRPYVVPMVLATGLVQSWFENGKVIASGDLVPPVEPAFQYHAHWNDAWTGTGGPSYSVVGFFYFETLRAAMAIGADEAQFQRVWLTALVALSVAAVVYFTRSITSHRWIPGIAGVLVFLNPYFLAAGANSIPLASLIVIGFLGGMVVRKGLRHEHAPRVTSFVLLSLALSFIAENPPHIYIIGLALALSIAVVAAGRGIQGIRVSAAFLSKAAPLVLLVNLWWIVPLLLTVLNPLFAGQVAVAGFEDWAWTHARGALANVVAMKSTWAWTEPAYVPFAARLSNPPFDVLGYALPLLAGLGVVLARGLERRIAVILAGGGGIVLLIAKGMHPPLSGLNRSLYEWLPGYWLLREPFKVLLLLAFIFAILAAIALSRLLTTPVLPAPVRITGAMILLVSALVYVHPVYTGEVIPDSRPVLPSSYVQLPDDWRRAIRFLNARPVEGKLLVLPLPDFYQLPTSWGYYGVPFTRYAIERPVLEPLPGGYFAPARGVTAIAASIEDDLRRRKLAHMMPKLQALGITYVLVRGDLDREFPGHAIGDPDVIATSLQKLPGARRHSFGMLEVYELPLSLTSEVSARPGVSYGGSAAAIPGALELATPRVLVDSPAGVGVAHSQTAEDTFALIPWDEWRISAKQGDSGVSLRLVGFRRGAPRPRSEPRFVHLPRIVPPVLLEIGRQAFAIKRLRPKAWTPIGLIDGGSKIRIRVWRPPRASASTNGQQATSIGTPSLDYERVSPSEFRVDVSDARMPFVLAISESYAPGWEIDAGGRNSTEARHVTVNGYANGWVVPWTGTYEVTIRYSPEERVTWARWIGIVSVGGVLLVWLATSRRMRRLRASRRRAAPTA